MTMITPSYLGETIEYSSLHACRSTLEDPTPNLHYPMLENFVDAIEGKTPLLASGTSSYGTDWVTEQARKNQRAG